MRTLILLAFATFLVYGGSMIDLSNKNSFTGASSINLAGLDTFIEADDEVAKFLVCSADARLMDSSEGKLAIEKGTESSIKQYGKWMVKDQGILLGEIKMLATKRKIQLPSTISDKKKHGREKLAKKSGKSFDKKFIKMMIIDHERDIKLFENASHFKDSEISQFAKAYLPTIKSHLSKIEMIKEEMND